MALSVLSIELLSRLRQNGRLDNPTSVIEIGAQQLTNEFLLARQQIEDLGRLFGVTQTLNLPSPQQSYTVEGGAEHLPETAPLARGFWEWLGFEYASVDIDGSPKSIPVDLNFDAAPETLKKRFGLVTNFGTTEHVANQLNAFEVIHDLTAVGGIMIHSVPAQGYINHGLVNYNPKWFWMLARSNHYEWLHFDYVARNDAEEFPQNVADMVMSYEPDIAERKKRYQFADCWLNVNLRKVRDLEFVPPVDVATGTRTANATLLKRYWTVYLPQDQ